jgi:hypothetical protein
MRKDKDIAFKLRKSGKSFNQIKLELGIPKSTLSDWFIDQKWSNKIALNLRNKANIGHIIRIKALNKVRGNNLSRLYEEAKKEAVQDYKKLKYHPLFIAGLMIYWGEGNKASRNRCGIANTEPAMIKVFMNFLFNVCGIAKEKTKAWILLYPDLNEKICKDYWIQNTGLKHSDFTKSIIIKGKHKTKKLNYGVCNFGANSVYLKCKILVWINLLAKDLAD